MTYEVVKQYIFEVPNVGEVRGEIIKHIDSQMPNPYLWRTNCTYKGYAPNHGGSFEVAQSELFYYIEQFDKNTAEYQTPF